MNGNRGGGSGGSGASDFEKKEKQQPQEKKIEEPVPSPAPFKNERPLQGAWGQMRAAAAVSTTPVPPTESVAVPQSPLVPEQTPMTELKTEEELATTTLDATSATKEDEVSGTFIDENIMETNNDIPQKPVTATKSSGNVWATKGSAHLIQAEKPKPPPSPTQKTVQHTEPKLPQEQPLTLEQLDDLAGTPVTDDVPNTASSATEAMDNGLPPSVNGANINASGWEPTVSGDNDVIHQSTIESVSNAPSTVDAPLMLSDVKEDSVLKEVETNAVAHDQSRKSEVLNMGHWETGDAEESQSLDFGFGLENDVASVDETTISSTTNNVTSVPATVAEPQAAPISTKAEATIPSTTATATVSAAVASTSSVVSGLPPPPPGLGVAMPPLPDKIVHVHELENKLESASLAAGTKEEPVEKKTVDAPLPEKVTNNLTPTTQASSSTSTVNATTSTTQPEGFMQMPHGVMSQNFNAGAYGMGGVYNGYNAQTGVNTAFMGLPTPAGPVVSPSSAAAGVLPQQQKQPNVPGQQQGVPNGLQQQQPQQQQQGSGLYGIPNAANQENNTSNDSNPTNNPSSGMPPGMQHGMPYNPALFYGQQHYQMGPSHGVGYGYGYGAQFGGVGGGFGYQQMAMQAGGAYGQPYDEQAQHHGTHNNNHQGNNNGGSGGGSGSGGYNKNGGGGGYRGGRNNHNNHNNHHNQQYQNQYNPGGHGGYGAQPYNMGYGDFNQRGGYGPPSDHYMQNSYQSSTSGFSQEDGQQLGGAKGNKSKGNNRNNNFNGNMHQQYQQHGGGSGGSPQLSGVTSQSSHHQQFSGLQGGNTSENTVNNNTSTGLSYQSWGGGL